MTRHHTYQYKRVTWDYSSRNSQRIMHSQVVNNESSKTQKCGYNTRSKVIYSGETMINLITCFWAKTGTTNTSTNLNSTHYNLYAQLFSRWHCHSYRNTSASTMLIGLIAYLEIHSAFMVWKIVGRADLTGPNFSEPAWSWFTIAVEFQWSKEAGQLPHEGLASNCFQQHFIFSGINISIIAFKISFCYDDCIYAYSGAGRPMQHNVAEG